MPAVSQIVTSNEFLTPSDTARPKSKSKNPVLSSRVEWQQFEDSTILITQTLGETFVKILGRDTEVEHVYWAFEEWMLRIWTVINAPNSPLEEKISEAQLKFMERFPELDCDFTVIYRFGKPFEEIRPLGSWQAFPTT